MSKDEIRKTYILRHLPSRYSETTGQIAERIELHHLVDLIGTIGASHFRDASNCPMRHSVDQRYPTPRWAMLFTLFVQNRCPLGSGCPSQRIDSITACPALYHSISK